MLMSHTYHVESLAGFLSTASTNCKNAVIENTAKGIYGVQFHPEVVHTPEGKRFYITSSIIFARLMGIGRLHQLLKIK